HAHSLTFSCFRRQPFLMRERACQWLIAAIHRARTKHASGRRTVCSPSQSLTCLSPSREIWHTAMGLRDAEIYGPAGFVSHRFIRTIAFHSYHCVSFVPLRFTSMGPTRGC